MEEGDAVERKRLLSRERGRRYRERHPERARENARKRGQNYRSRHPDVVRTTQKAHATKKRQEINADLFAAISAKTDLFWSNLPGALADTECWDWQGWKSKAGYGGFGLSSGRWVSASRASLMLKLGRNLTTGMFACHTCDNPSCCNPTHLYEGTPQQNAADRGIRNRQTPRRGEKITPETAKMIFDEAGSHSAIGRKYEVSRTMVANIKLGRAWKRIHAGTITHA